MVFHWSSSDPVIDSVFMLSICCMPIFILLLLVFEYILNILYLGITSLTCGSISGLLICETWSYVWVNIETIWAHILVRLISWCRISKIQVKKITAKHRWFIGLLYVLHLISSIRTCIEYIKSIWFISWTIIIVLGIIVLTLEAIIFVIPICE